MLCGVTVREVLYVVLLLTGVHAAHGTITTLLQPYGVCRPRKGPLCNSVWYPVWLYVWRSVVPPLQHLAGTRKAVRVGTVLCAPLGSLTNVGASLTNVQQCLMGVVVRVFKAL